MANNNLKILFAAAEVVPFAKTGGLADVAGALPKVLAAMGHDVRIVMPKYGCVDEKKFNLRPVTAPFGIPHGDETIEVAIEESDAIDGVKTYFVRNDYLFDRPTLYGQPDDDHRFIAYCRAMLEMLPVLGWTPDVIHCNDWHTGLTPVYLKTLYANHPELRNIVTLYTIHNLAYQGTFPKEVMEVTGLPTSLFTWDKLEFYGKFNFMKGGLIFADALSTVSETYATETQTKEYGAGLEGVLAYRKADYYGIINGIDNSLWNPATDPLIPHNFTAEALDGKRANKRALQRAVGLPETEDVALLGLISRLSAQKGFDLLDDALPELLKTHPMQVVILGAGEEYFQEMLTKLAKKFPEKLAVALKFDNTLAHQIYAGSDAFLMPSHYEPCGLGQMISMAYGTVPVVRATGGLADTVKEFKGLRSTGNGFLFEDYQPEALTTAVERCLKCYFEKRECWNRVVQNAFKSDFSWESSAKKYVKVYREAMKRMKHLEMAA